MFVSKHLFCKVQIISKPLPRLDLGDLKTGATVRERRKEKEAPSHSGKNHACSDPAAHLASGSHALAHRAGSRSAVTLDGG